jgi:hypothetical protein
MAKTIQIIPGDGKLEFYGTGGTAGGNPCYWWYCSYWWNGIQRR